MNVGAIARGIGPVDGTVLDQLEEALILADVGAELSGEYVDALRAAWRRGELPDTDALRARMRSMVADTLAPRMIPLKVVPPYPFVVLVVGVNGVGKTTTIGKVASGLREEGRTVLLAAADTFRAAAIEQLAVWAERTGAASSGTRRVRTPRPWRSTPCGRRRPGGRTWFSSTPRGASTRSPT